MPRITVSLPDGTEVVHELTDELITVGRVEENSLCIVDASVSSRHATLTLDEGDYILRDIGSTNGTRLNGRDIAEGEDHKLQDGDGILFGKINAIYASENPAAEERPLPQEEEVSSSPASFSARPADFSNASPFQTKKKKKSGGSMAVMALGIIALLACGGAIFTVLQMTSPM